jgi:hypothetical protein
MIVASTIVPVPDLQAPRLQDLAHLGKQRLTQLLVLQQTAELQQRRCVGHSLASQIDSNKPPQRRAVEQRVFARGIGQVEPVLHEIHPQHPFKAHRRAAVAGLRVVRRNHLAQLRPRHDLLHGRQEHITPRRLAVLLVLRVLIGRHCQGLLLHFNATPFQGLRWT